MHLSTKKAILEIVHYFFKRAGIFEAIRPVMFPSNCFESPVSCEGKLSYQF